jgi:uncharacterized membrane protein YdcZ (DUF606 family)
VATGILVAVAAGVLIGVQVAALSRQTQTQAPLAVSLLVQLGGLLVATLWTLARRSWGEVAAAASGWWWVPVGVAGWLILAALGSASARVGVAMTLAVSVAVQIVVGLLWDARVGQAALDARSAAGAVLLVLGVYLLSGR